VTVVEWIVVGSFAVVIALITLAVVCALVLAGQCDDMIEARETSDPWSDMDAVVFDWPIAAPSARVIEFPRARARDREGGGVA
jgi:hypothetical protein